MSQARGDERDALRRLAADEGARWATSSLAALASEGRATGGWPGTRSEARMRVEASAMLRGVLTDVVLGEELAHLVYQAARRHWQLYATREQPA